MRISIRLILIIIAVILIAGCDRFEHNFIKPTYPLVEQLYASFSDSLLQISDIDVESISSFYADNYLNNGINKVQMEQYYRNLFINHPNSIIVADSTYDFDANSLSFQWRLKLTNLAGDSTFIDTLFTDQIALHEGKYQFIGNQYDPGEPSPKQKVLAQIVTGTGCANCVAIEAALHACELRFPGQFYYLEHHYNDFLELPNISEFMLYYDNIFSSPTTIFQGITKYLEPNNGDLAQFTALTQDLLNQDAKYDLANLTYTISGDTLHASIEITPKSALTHTNLVFNYVIADKVSTLNNLGGLPCRNVILKRSSKDISAMVLPGTVDFTLQIPVNLPTDAKIVAWVQTMNTPWDSQSLIYNVIEKDIFRK